MKKNTLGRKPRELKDVPVLNEMGPELERPPCLVISGSSTGPT